MRRDVCYLRHHLANGTCSSDLLRPQTKVVCCCSGLGQGWGSNGSKCVPCPEEGTSAHAALCGMGRDVPQGMVRDPVTNAPRQIDVCRLMPGELGSLINFVYRVRQNGLQ